MDHFTDHLFDSSKKPTSRFRQAFCCFLALVLAFSMTPLHMKSAEAAVASYQIPVKYGQTEARSMLKMINDFRDSGAKCWNANNTQQVTYSGLQHLTYDYALEKVAMQRAAEIAVSFDHERPDGTICFDLFPSGYYTYGENIAAGSSTAQGAFNQWREDDEYYSGQGHRRNMLNSDYTSVGIGHVVFNGAHFWVQNFGAPNSNASQTAADNSSRNVKVGIDDAKLSGKSLAPTTKSLLVETGKSTTLPSVEITLSIPGRFPSTRFSFATPVVWKSNNPAIATINGTKVVGKKTGNATLTATSNGMRATVRVAVAPKPSAVSLKSVKGGKKSVTVKWGKAKVGTGYEIWCSTSKKFTKKTTVKKTVSKIKTVSLVVKKLKKNKTYYVKVRSINKDKASGKVLYSNWSKVKKAKTKK